MRLGGRLVLFCGVSVASLPATAANADVGGSSFVEIIAGLANPIADDDYADAFDTSVKVGARVGTWRGDRAFDLAVDVTPLDTRVETAFADIDVDRYRLQVGARFERSLGRTTRAFGRFAAGLDVVDYGVRGQVLGIAFEASETDLGLAFEIGGGITADVGHVSIGGQLGLPMALHFDEDDPGDPDDADLDYTGLDIDLLFVMMIPL